jgi:hypothetical protein
MTSYLSTRDISPTIIPPNYPKFLGRFSFFDSAPAATAYSKFKELEDDRANRGRLRRIEELYKVLKASEREKERSIYSELRPLQHECACAFGKLFGWHPTRQDFSPKTLARRGTWTRTPPEEWCMLHVDHIDKFRDEQNRAAACIGHMYQSPEMLASALPRWASENGLTVVFPLLTSWYWPTRTTVILYIPAEGGDR